MRVRKATKNAPPITTTASGFCVCAPIAFDTAAGSRPGQAAPTAANGATWLGRRDNAGTGCAQDGTPGFSEEARLSPWQL